MMYVKDELIKMMNLDVEDIKELMEENDYSGSDVEDVEFIGMNFKGDFIYRIKFDDVDDVLGVSEIDYCGDVYVRKNESGKFDLEF
jgi:hypothetical protein